jgi:PadR family transcriptional regulator, regulatory protein AphA
MPTDIEPEIELTPTSHIVLGLLALMGEGTPYDLKQVASETVGHFWSLAHSQLYSEPARLARAGYLTEEREQEGRRRKLYKLTDLGRKALEQWLEIPTPDFLEVRDLAVLKLFFGADPQAIAQAQLETHTRRLTSYEAMQELAAHANAQEMPIGPKLALKFGTEHERETVRFWSELVAEEDLGPNKASASKQAGASRQARV